MSEPASTPAGAGADYDAGLRTSRPPPAFRTVRRWTLDSPADLHVLRAGLHEEVDTRAHQPTNQPHGRAPAVVELLQHQRRFPLTVADHDPSTQPRLAGQRPPGQGGFGLQIARRLAVDVGWYRTNHTEVVWAELTT